MSTVSLPPQEPKARRKAEAEELIQDRAVLINRPRKSRLHLPAASGIATTNGDPEQGATWTPTPSSCPKWCDLAPGLHCQCLYSIAVDRPYSAEHWTLLVRAGPAAILQHSGRHTKLLFRVLSIRFFCGSATQHSSWRHDDRNFGGRQDLNFQSTSTELAFSLCGSHGIGTHVPKHRKSSRAALPGHWP